MLRPLLRSSVAELAFPTGLTRGNGLFSQRRRLPSSRLIQANFRVTLGGRLEKRDVYRPDEPIRLRELIGNGSRAQCQFRCNICTHEQHSVAVGELAKHIGTGTGAKHQLGGETDHRNVRQVKLGGLVQAPPIADRRRDGHLIRLWAVYALACAISQHHHGRLDTPVDSQDDRGMGLSRPLSRGKRRVVVRKNQRTHLWVGPERLPSHSSEAQLLQLFLIRSHAGCMESTSPVEIEQRLIAPGHRISLRGIKALCDRGRRPLRMTRILIAG